MLDHVVPLDEPSVAVGAAVRLLSVVYLSVAVEGTGIGQLLVARLALDHGLAARADLGLAVGWKEKMKMKFCNYIMMSVLYITLDKKRKM